MLTCSCPEWDGGWCYDPPNDFTLFSAKRRKRCCSCNELINRDTDCLQFHRSRYARNEIENRIYGEDEEIPLAPWYMCEDCGEIYLNLDSLGFCMDIGLDMREELKEYQHDYSGEQWQKFKEAYVTVIDGAEIIVEEGKCTH